MHHQMTSEKRPWPTLKGRLSQPLTSRVEAVRQLQTTMPLTPVAQGMLKQSNGASSIGPKKTGSFMAGLRRLGRVPAAPRDRRPINGSRKNNYRTKVAIQT